VRHEASRQEETTLHLHRWFDGLISLILMSRVVANQGFYLLLGARTRSDGIYPSLLFNNVVVLSVVTGMLRLEHVLQGRQGSGVAGIASKQERKYHTTMYIWFTPKFKLFRKDQKLQ